MFRICDSRESILQPGQLFLYDPGIVVPQNGSIRLTIRSTSPHGDIAWYLIHNPFLSENTNDIANGLINPLGYHSQVINRLDAGGYTLELECRSYPISCSGIGRIENV